MLKSADRAAWAARALASFLFRPEPSNVCESTVTDITKFLAWLSPLSDTNSYLRPGRSSLRIMTGFLPLVEEEKEEKEEGSGSGACTRLFVPGAWGRGYSPSGFKEPLPLEPRKNISSDGAGVSNPLKSMSGKSAWSEVKSVLTVSVRPMARCASDAFGNCTKERSAFSAAFSLAFFFVGPEPSNNWPLTSTVMTKTGAWTGPVCESSLYCRPGLISFSCIRAFLGRTGPGVFLRFLALNLECAWPLLPSSRGRLRPPPPLPLGSCSTRPAPSLEETLSRLRFSFTSVLHEPAVPRKSNLQRLRCRIL